MNNLFNISINQFQSQNFNNIKGSFGYSYDNNDKNYFDNTPSPLLYQEINNSYKSTIFNANPRQYGYHSLITLNPLHKNTVHIISNNVAHHSNDQVITNKNEPNLNLPMSKLNK